MVRRFSLVLLMSGLFCLNEAVGETPSQWRVSSDDAGPALFLESSLAYSDPDYAFGSAYQGREGVTYSGGLDVGVRYEDTRISVARIGIIRTDETFEYLDPTGTIDAAVNRRAKKTGTYFALDGYVPFLGIEKGYVSLDYGTRIGGANLRVSDELFDVLGGTTGTELGIENGKTQFSQGFNVGSSLHLFGRFSVGYSFMWNQEPKVYKFWHTLISGTLQYSGLYLLNTAPDWVAPREVEQSIPYQLLSLAVLVGSSAALFDATYDDYNWPYEEASPLRSHAHRLTMNIAVF